MLVALAYFHAPQESYFTRSFAVQLLYSMFHSAAKSR